MIPKGRLVRLGGLLGVLALGGCGTRGVQALKDAVGLKPKFHAFNVVDAKQGGLVVSRFAVPEGWRASGQAKWNYNDFYLPVHTDDPNLDPNHYLTGNYQKMTPVHP